MFNKVYQACRRLLPLLRLTRNEQTDTCVVLLTHAAPRRAMQRGRSSALFLGRAVNFYQRFKFTGAEVHQLNATTRVYSTKATYNVMI